MRNAIIEALNTRVFSASPPSIVEALAERVAVHPEKIAVRCGDDGVTWAKLDAESGRLARALKTLGIGTGDYVTIALPNDIAFISVVYAIWKVGAVPQPVSYRLPAEELRAIIELADSVLIVAERDPDIGRRVMSPQQLLAIEAEGIEVPPAISPAWKAPTSGGSTGRPKLIVAGSPAVVQERMIAMWRFTAGDTVAMPGPMYHNAPFSIVFPALMAGASVVLLRRFDAEELLRVVADNAITFAYVVPTMMSRIMKLPAETRAKYDVSSLKTVWHMAAPCPAWLKEAWIEWLGADAIWELYGGTEGVAFTILDGNEWLAHRGSVGSIAAGLGIEAFAPDGEMLARGIAGELFMKHDPATPRPYRYIGADDRMLGDEWFSIGDFGWLDEDGYLYLVDRRSDLIIVGGVNVYPAEIESVLDEHPAVQSSCVIGLPDDDLGARVHAIVQAENLDAFALQGFLGERLAKVKWPRSFEFVREPLRDEAGKVRRSALREARVPVSFTR